jgi:hypothetical protein
MCLKNHVSILVVHRTSLPKWHTPEFFFSALLRPRHFNSIFPKLFLQCHQIYYLTADKLHNFAKNKSSISIYYVCMQIKTGRSHTIIQPIFTITNTVRFYDSHCRVVTLDYTRSFVCSLALSERAQTKTIQTIVQM